MTKKLTPAEGARKDVSIPRTRGQSEEEKKKGSMLGNRTDLNKMRKPALVNMITTKMNTNIVDNGHNNNIEEEAL